VRGELTCGGPVPWLGSFAAFHPPPPASLHHASARFVRPRTHTADCRGPLPLAEPERRHRRAAAAAGVHERQIGRKGEPQKPSSHCSLRLSREGL
jgi:hypothetical protein